MYKQLRNLGDSKVNTLPIFNNDPLTSCIGNTISQRFNHGSNSDTYGQNSRPCQAFLTNRCSVKWDPICEYVTSSAIDTEYSANANMLSAGANQNPILSSSEILLRNIAHQKYLLNMYNCTKISELFNPLNPTSPTISYFIGQNCIPEFIVDPKTINNDPVMNKLLEKPYIAPLLLKNIKNTMNRLGVLHTLKGTKLGMYYNI